MRLLLLATLFVCGVVPFASAGRFVCYFPNWAIQRQDPWQFGVDNIDTRLCTHLVYSFADLDDSTLQIKSSNPVVDIVQKGYRKFTGLKSQNPSLKTMLAFGGWGDSNINDKYSRMVSTSENIQMFVDSALRMLTDYGFDGLDVDWEFPRTEADKIGFSNLLAALKKAFAPYNYVLSAAVPALPADLGYDIPSIEASVDFINLMTYDMHGPWEPETADHHAPLRKRSWETADNNVEYSIDYWIENGLSANKINLGMPLYGHSWKLSSDITSPPAPASGGGTPGPFTGEEGILSYFEICLAVQNEGWQVVQDPDQLTGPYALSNTNVVNWIGFDDVAMLTTKSNFILSRGLGGAMVWEISLDDFRGSCGAGVNPLLTAISRIVVA